MAMQTLPGPLLCKRTTLRLGGKAQAELRVESPEDFDKLPETLSRLGGTPFVLGRGSNILACDGELPITVVSLSWPGKIKLLREEAERVLIRADATTPLPHLLLWLATNGFSGLEGLTGIPGAVGGAVAMNAGSFGCEMGECLQRVRVFTQERGLTWLEPGEFKTDYRKFKVTDKVLNGSGLFIISQVELEMVKDARESIKARMRKYRETKKATQPIEAHSAGCVFKNPAADQPAGMLLDKAGLKGKRVGDIAFSEKHANFLINLGQGTSRQAMELMDMAKSAVAAEFGFQLEREVKLCPCS